MTELQFVEDSPHGLPPEEEQRLAAAIHAEETPEEEKVKAVHALVMANLRFALFRIRRVIKDKNFIRRHQEDLEGEVFLMLTKSAWAFKPGYGKFCSYATK